MIHARRDYDKIQDPRKKIPENEPVFLIRAQDMISGDVLRYWARRNLEVGGSIELSALAEAHALRMDRWKIKKFADI